MGSALTYGAAANDQLLLLEGSEPPTPVGSQAANPIRVRVVAADGVTPVNGATLAWTTTNGAKLSLCSAATACSVLSDQSGESSTWVTPMVTGQSTVTVTLAPAAYASPPSKQVAVQGVSSSPALDLAAVTPTRWIGQGATIDVPLTVQALKAGVPQSSVVVNYKLTVGAATLSAGSATTNTSGYATVSAHLANHSADVQISACVAPNNVPCQSFTLHAVPASLWTLEIMSGSVQMVPEGQSFQPLVLRVTDGSAAANPVMGVNVAFNTTLARVPPGSGSQTEGDSIVGAPGMAIILGLSSTQAVTTQDGIASIVPGAGTVVGPCDLFIAVNAGPAAAQFHLQIVAAIAKHSPASLPLVPGIRPEGPQSTLGGAWLFAVPDGIASGGLPVDSRASACSESSADDSARDQAGAVPANPAEGESSVSPPCARSKPAKTKTPKKPAAQKDSDTSPATASAPATARSDASSSTRPPSDRRSCRVLAEDGTPP